MSCHVTSNCPDTIRETVARRRGALGNAPDGLPDWEGMHPQRVHRRWTLNRLLRRCRLGRCAAAAVVFAE